MTQQTAKIKEIFTSIQGEGPLIGYKQLFIRFCGCNLDCDYCDTDFSAQNDFLEFTPQELFDYIAKLNLTNLHSISLTGGEPLVWSEFLKDFLYKMSLFVYLETNATMAENIGDILEFVDFISADIKLPSTSCVQNSFLLHDNFFKSLRKYTLECAIHKHFNCENKNIFAKIVFDNNITDDEVLNSVYLAKKYDFEIILQPKMDGNKLSVTTDEIEVIFDKFLKEYEKVRLIPQTHKFLSIR